MCSLYPQSSEWVAVDGEGYILDLVGGRMCVCVCCGDILLSVIVLYRGALSNCTQEKADLQPHIAVLSSS